MTVIEFQVSLSNKSDDLPSHNALSTIIEDAELENLMGQGEKT